MKKRKLITLAMSNGCVGLGGYPIKVYAIPIKYNDGTLSHYLVSDRVYRSKILNDQNVLALSDDGTPVARVMYV